MTTISFNLTDKHIGKKSQINAKINALLGDFHAIPTKDGIAYMVDFESDSNAKVFEQWLVKLIPNITDFI